MSRSPAHPLESTLRLTETVTPDGRPNRLAIWWAPPGATPVFHVVDGARVTVGRGPDVTVALAGAGVSRCHVELYRQGPATIAHDLGSTNGTYVNGRRAQYAALADGDVVRLGDVVGVVTRVGAATSAGVPDVEVVAPDLTFGPGLAPELADLRRAAPCRLPVLIVGETGTGKEYVARAVHVLSGRRAPFHPVNCAALPAALAEAELFGHSRGAFTGAEQATLGHIRAADGGTLFLDELADLPLPVQAKLLRVLQDGHVMPLGETRAHPVDLRIVAACQQSPEDLVVRGRLRQDLAARLCGLTIVVPPLRERRLDIAVFLRRFMERHGASQPPAVDSRLLEALLLHDWPGNLRELDMLTQRLLALHGNQPVLRRSHLPAAMRRMLPCSEDEAAAPAPPRPAVEDRAQHDRGRFARELRANGGNITRAAAAAGLSRARAYRLMGARSPDRFLSELGDDEAAAD